MNVSEYIDYIQSADRNRALMARVLLNALGHEKKFPIDISELRQLSPRNRAIVNAFEEWSFSQPGFVMSGASLPGLIECAEGRKKMG